MAWWCSTSRPICRARSAPCSWVTSGPTSSRSKSPQGDSMRGAPPFIAGEGAPFMLWNRNKRGIRLDLKDADDLLLFWDLVDGADVVLENFRPGVIERLGIGWPALHARNPRLVLGSISGFGQTGPYASRGGFDLMMQAMSGLMSVTGP